MSALRGKCMNVSDLRKKAEAGGLAAQGILGVCYLEGIDVDVDYKEAYRFLSLAAERGAPRPQFFLARMFAEGLGIAKDFAQALRLFESAANKGEFQAQIQLGRIYSRGIGVRADPQTASRWYAEAVAQEDKIADCEELTEAKAYLSARDL